MLIFVVVIHLSSLDSQGYFLKPFKVKIFLEEALHPSCCVYRVDHKLYLRSRSVMFQIQPQVKVIAHVWSVMCQLLS